MEELSTAGRHETPNRVQRGEQQRAALRALVMGDRPSAPSFDPAGLATMAGWWSTRSWLPSDAHGALDQIARSCALLSERADRALAFEVSRMALSVRATLTEALAAPSADLSAPSVPPRQRKATSCPLCGSLAASDGVMCEGVLWLEHRCDSCGGSMRLVRAPWSALPRVDVLSHDDRVLVDGEHLLARRWEIQGQTMMAAVHGETLRPVLIGRAA